MHAGEANAGSDYAQRLASLISRAVGLIYISPLLAGGTDVSPFHLPIPILFPHCLSFQQVELT